MADTTSRQAARRPSPAASHHKANADTTPPRRLILTVTTYLFLFLSQPFYFCKHLQPAFSGLRPKRPPAAAVSCTWPRSARSCFRASPPDFSKAGSSSARQFRLRRHSAFKSKRDRYARLSRLLLGYEIADARAPASFRRQASLGSARAAMRRQQPHGRLATQYFLDTRR